MKLNQGNQISLFQSHQTLQTLRALSYLRCCFIPSDTSGPPLSSVSRKAWTEIKELYRWFWEAKQLPTTTQRQSSWVWACWTHPGSPGIMRAVHNSLPLPNSLDRAVRNTSVGGDTCWTGICLQTFLPQCKTILLYIGITVLTNTVNTTFRLLPLKYHESQLSILPRVNFIL